MRARAAAFAALVVLSGCALRTLPVREVRGEEQRIGEWIARVKSEGDARRALRADGQLRLASPRGKGAVREVIVAERPDRLRLESLNVLGQTQSVLVVDGGRFGWFEGGPIQYGTEAEQVLRERLGLDLSADDVLEALFVDPPLQLPLVSPVWGQGDERIVQVKTHRVRFGPGGDLLEVESLDAQGAVRWRAVYDRWREAEGGRYPFGVKLFIPSSDASAELELREVVLNSTLDPALFVLPERSE
jgi:hypothetical protein